MAIELRLAKDVRDACRGDVSCPEHGCRVRFAPTGKHRVVLVDPNGRPFCDQHARARSPDYAALYDGYEAARKVIAEAVVAGRMSNADASFCYELWDGGPLPPP